MNGQSEIYAALNVSAITSLLDKRTSTDTNPALIGDLVVPSAWTAKRTINFYLTSPVVYSDELPSYVYTVNCRAATQYQSQNIAATVASTLSRRTLGNGYIKSKQLRTIPPADSTDTYNTPVEVTVYLS